MPFSAVQNDIHVSPNLDRPAHALTTYTQLGLKAPCIWHGLWSLRSVELVTCQPCPRPQAELLLELSLLTPKIPVAQQEGIG